MSDPMSPEARSIVEAARDADEPTEADRRRVRGALIAAIAAGGTAGTAGTAEAAGGAGAGTAGLLALKVLAALVLAGGAGAGVYAFFSGPAPAKAPPALEASRPATAPAAPATAPAPEPKTHAAAGAADAPASPAAPVMEFEPDPVAAPRGRSHTHERKPSTLAAERALIARAKTAREAGEPRRALELLDEYRRAFRGGILLEERGALRILVLCDLHRPGPARREAKRFRARWPESIYIPRLDGSCAGD